MSRKGIVFDIQRASLHDGPGIRTTVFLKGCPLDCLWCHNPESTIVKRQLFFQFDKCVACKTCVQVCPEKAHYFTDDKHIIDFDKCTLCGKCVENCPSDALRIVGCEMGVDEVMTEVIADVDFYKNSGGGITLSGGEPLSQFTFSLELLKKCKEMGVHTCVETSGEVNPKKFEQILKYVDVLLFDYKVTNNMSHIKFTGVPNLRILTNLETAYNFGVPIILRCPIIPGVNNTDEHFIAISELDRKYPKLQGIEILPYHTMGNNKRISIGFDETLTGLKTVTPELAAKWIEHLRELGCEKVKIG